MWKIADALYLGTKEDAADLTLLKSNQVSHVINCALELPCYFEEELEYLALSLKDPDHGLLAQLERAMIFIDRGRRHGAVMVHCSGAISRSPAVVLSYLCHCGLSIDEAAQRIRNVARTRPNDIFLHQVHEYLGLEMTSDGLERLIHKLGEQT